MSIDEDKPRSAQVLTTPQVVPNDSDSDEDAEQNVRDDDAEPAQDPDFLVDWPEDTEELELVHCRISDLVELHLTRFKDHLTKLCLRQNNISHLDPETFHTLVKLDELDLYDNQIKNVGRALDRLQELTVLDLSFNTLRAVPDALIHLPRLKTVYFVQNRISRIENLHTSVNLTSLELGGNRIRKIENIDALVHLEQLWLGKNKITKLENLDKLTKLRILSIQSNRITKLEGLEQLTELEELYISHNGVEKIEGLEHNIKLTTLDLSSNFISELENLSHLTQLEELWMSSNKIPNLHKLTPELKSISTLKTLYLEGNPCQRDDMTGYRRKIMLALPGIQQIDATYARGAART